MTVMPISMGSAISRQPKLPDYRHSTGLYQFSRVNLFSQYCPTFSRGTLWLWNSPTFTTWGNYGVQSLRLILVTPLLLTQFNETEIAAWYLFASLNFFGVTLSQRLGLTFSRMFAFAMGGASNLAPIKGRRPIENDGEPNWLSFERAYGTIGSLNLAIGWLNVLIALGMGWFGLGNLLEGYEAKDTVWLAFGLMLTTSLIVFNFQRYSIALQGMNYIALVNRWQTAFSLLSLLAGIIVLSMGGGLVALVAAMQSFILINILRNYVLLRYVKEGRILKFRQYGFDREVFNWAWEPTWKGFVGQFGQMGSLQMTAILYTAYGSKGEVASYLFALRMMQTITQIAQAPFSSVQPLMSRLRAAGEMEKLKTLVQKRAGFSLGLTLAGICAAAIGFPVALDFIDSNLEFIPVQAWLLFGALTMIARFNVICCSVGAIGNEMIYYWEMAAAAVFSCLAIFLIQNQPGVYGPILASMLPLVLILNAGPFFKAKKILKSS